MWKTESFVSQMNYLLPHLYTWVLLSSLLSPEFFKQKLLIIQKFLSFFYLIINNSHMDHASLVGKTEKKKIRNTALLLQPLVKTVVVTMLGRQLP